eukprot:SAG31_NODE_4079_length_3608_cov_2.597436_3_plen_69_part_00
MMQQWAQDVLTETCSQLPTASKGGELKTIGESSPESIQFHAEEVLEECGRMVSIVHNHGVWRCRLPFK